MMRGLRNEQPDESEPVKKAKKKFRISDDLARSLGYPPKDEKTKKDYEHFKYLENCNDKTVEGDIKDYNELLEAFDNLGFSAEEVDAINKITAASLQCGQLQLDKLTYNESKNIPVNIKNKDTLKSLCGLLGIKSPEELEAEIVNKEKNEYGRTPLKF